MSELTTVSREASEELIAEIDELIGPPYHEIFLQRAFPGSKPSDDAAINTADIGRVNLSRNPGEVINGEILPCSDIQPRVMEVDELVPEASTFTERQHGGMTDWQIETDRLHQQSIARMRSADVHGSSYLDKWFRDYGARCKSIVGVVRTAITSVINL